MNPHPSVHAIASRAAPRPLSGALPLLPARHLARPRLLQRLLGGRQRVNLLHAPAGFGKSVLLNECARQAGPRGRVAWLDLRGRPLRPDDFLRRLAIVLDLDPAARNWQDDLQRLLEGGPQPLWIVLDDYPRQADAELDACVAGLLENSAADIRWWIGARRRPDWNLPRLLLQGELLELGAADLALDRDELEQLLRKQPAEAAEDEADELLGRSAGWPALLGLLALQGRLRWPEAGGGLLHDYLRREVLAPLPAPLREALRVLAHLPRFKAGLCRHLAPVGEAAFAQLEQMQLLRRLDEGSGWFALWPPLAELLRQAHDEAPPADALLAASQWFAEHGDLRQATQLALAAGSIERAVALLQDANSDQMMVEHSAVQLLRWRDELPEGLLQSSPKLILLETWALILCARLDEAMACLQGLSRFLPRPDAHRQRLCLAHYQATLGVLQRQFALPDARRNCSDALQHLEERFWGQHILCHQALAQQAMVEGDLTVARQHCQAGLRLSRRHANLCFEALLSVEHIHLLALSGEHRHALDYAEQMLAELRKHAHGGPMSARLHVLRGELLALRGDDTGAEAGLQRGLREAEESQDAYLLYAYHALISLACERGEVERAHQLLLAAERRMQRLCIPEIRYREVLRLARARLCLASGEPARARDELLGVLAELGLNPLLAPTGFYDLQYRVRLLLAQAHDELGETTRASHELQALQRDCQRLGLRSLACETQLRLAETLHALDQAAAEEHLREALQDCRRLSLLRPLARLQRNDASWSRQLLAQLPALAPANRAPGTAEAQPAPAEMLSQRELEVLELIAQGCSNQEIAEQLEISLHTVKTHARRINIKLEVERRTQAVARAKASGLLA
ncbi:LuxR C-terminal-related transcriptional regulator [Pseudomonas sp. JH-2]|uniref:LuxR C-terminal-related transcriptional regulator n=1 Tax=Pseudomonas sp. JH-2 TaxID=3114998 RepID=UPI002E25FCEF|nr:LuxR C-terminal-related transcriptional regulator [Pseudomonas sp. JH-2]